MNKSLLRRGIESGRYDVHELVRQYGETLLSDAGLTDGTRTAHSYYFAALIKKLEPGLKGRNQATSLTAFEVELDNVSAAWRWAVAQRDEDAIRAMLEGLYIFANARSYFKIGSELFRMAQAAWPLENGGTLAGRLAIRFPQETDPEVYAQALSIAEQAEDLHEIACGKRMLGHHLSHAEFDQEHGIPLLEESQKLFQDLGDEYYAAHVLDDLGWSYRLDGRQDEAIDLIQQSLDLRRAIGDRIGTANALRNMGGSFGGFASKIPASEQNWSEAKALSYELGDRLGVAWNAFLLASYWFYHGNFAKSRSLIAEGMPIAADLSDPVVLGVTQVLLGMIEIVENDDLPAGKALITSGFPPGTPVDFRGPTAFTAQAIIGAEEGNWDEALAAVVRFVHSWAFDAVNPSALMWCGGPVVCVLAHHDQKTTAVEIMSQREHSDTYAMAWVDHWKPYQTLQHNLRQELGAQTFEEHWDKGKNLDFSALITLLLSLAGEE